MNGKKEAVERIRQFNRFYTVLIGTLDRNFLGCAYSVTETRILFELRSNENCSAKEIAEKLHIDKSYMSRIMKAFEKKGLIAREVSTQDRRAQVIRLTPKGESEVKLLIGLTNTQIGGLISNLNEEECQKICEAMDLITEYLSK